MRMYAQQMIETRTYDVLYYVEANSEEEAKNMIATGDTVKEVELKCREVLNRDEWDEIEKIPAKRVKKLKAEWAEQEEKENAEREKQAIRLTAELQASRINERGEYEMDDGGCIQPPDEDSGTIRRLDKDGNTQEVRERDDPNYRDWANLFKS